MCFFKKFFSRREFVFFVIIFFKKIKSFALPKSSLKIKKLNFPGVFGLNFISNDLYAPSLTGNVLIKYNEIKSKVSYLNDFNTGWETILKKKNILKSIHFADLYNNNLLLTFYHTNKVLIYDPLKRKIIDIDKININKKLDGPSTSIFIKEKKLICVSEYHGNISFFDLSGKFKFDIKHILDKYNIKKPHSIKFYNNRYYVIDTFNKKICILNANLKLESTVTSLNLKSKYKSLKEIKLITPVSINLYDNKFYFISDIKSGIIITDSNFNILGNINDNYLKFKFNNFEIPKVLRPYDAIMGNENLYVANTHKDNVLKFLNFKNILYSDT